MKTNLANESNSKKTYVLVGGGSGGHLTPLVAVAEALKSLDDSASICHIGQRGENLSEVTQHKAIDESYEIRAGKFRRYHGESWLKQLLDVKTNLLNVRDVFRFIRGTFESYFLLKRLNPNAVFLKGGFVSVPVGYAARLLSIPYVTHDSDAIPGLANRMTAKHAVYNLTALPTKLYPYAEEKSRQVGIPTQKEFVKVTETLQAEARMTLEVPLDADILLSVGGGLGAQKINDAIVAGSRDLLKAHPKLIIIHLTGKSLYNETLAKYQNLLTEELMSRLIVIDFSTTLYQLSAAADIIITRAGATNIAEFAMQQKACIVVPAPHLTGGQQLHNAEVLQQTNAALIVQEDELDKLSTKITFLLDSKEERQKIAKSLNDLAVVDADKSIATLLEEM